MQIKFTAIAGEHDPEYLSLFDGYEYSNEDFTDYLLDELGHLKKTKGLRDGYMSFKLVDGVLHTVTTYQYDVELTPTEIDDLKDYTQGQWSDGIGEGFEQNPVFKRDYNIFSYNVENGEDLYISPWHHGQIITYEIYE